MKKSSTTMFDAIVVGAGFPRLYMLYQLRQYGFSAKVFEAADDLGGTWYWNRYPGCRCDIESMQYSYSFSEELQQEWNWSEFYSPQPEILRYLNYVADKFDLRKDIEFKARVTAAHFDEEQLRWLILFEDGRQVSARFCIMATGCLSASKIPNIQGLDTFKGDCYQTSRWPHHEIQWKGSRVAVIGTGSSAIQTIPSIVEQVDHLYVFQRTPNFSIPAWNRKLEPEYIQDWKMNYKQRRAEMRKIFYASLIPIGEDCSVLDVSEEKLNEIFEKQWQRGGLGFNAAFNDIVINEKSNEKAADFIRNKIRHIVKNPEVAETLIPTGFPLGTKRLCVDTNYFQTYNRDNVTLINLKKTSIDEITPTGIRTQDKFYEVDKIIFATGFDAMTGALLNMDLRGRSNASLKEKWSNGPLTFMGLMIADFPNLFTITGPGSPSVLTNMVPSIEFHVDSIVKLMDYARLHSFSTIEPSLEAENDWNQHCQQVASMSLFSKAVSWYNGSNIAGKPKVLLPYTGGFPLYIQQWEDLEKNDYNRLIFT